MSQNKAAFASTKFTNPAYFTNLDCRWINLVCLIRDSLIGLVFGSGDVDIQRGPIWSERLPLDRNRRPRMADVCPADPDG